ncbi:kelch repeat-containing protein, partial [Elusimicrobiota bacterium]
MGTEKLLFLRVCQNNKFLHGIRWLSYSLIYSLLSLGVLLSIAVPAAATTPTNINTAYVSSTVITWTYELDSPATETPFLVISTMSDFSTWASSQSGTVSDITPRTTTYVGLIPNTTYYFKVKVSTESNANYSSDVSTPTRIETPTSIYIDELSTTTITIAAYASTFTNLSFSGSGINIAKNGAYEGWSVLIDTWTTKADMPTDRSAFAGAVVGGRIYAMGGWNGSSLMAENEEYDPATNTWITKAPMLTPRRYFTGTAAGGKIYTFGGLGPSTTNEEYDPAANAWVAKSSMPTARWILTSAQVGGKIYAIGGDVSTGIDSVATNEEYDPATDTWTTKASMPVPLADLASAVVGGKIYAIGGEDGDGPLAINLEYDPAINAWTTKASMPTDRWALTSAVVGGKIYAIGGHNAGGYITANEEYNPATNAWTARAPMPTARRYLISAAVGGRIYSIGGWNDNSLAATEEYSPGLSTRFTDLSINTQYTFTIKARNQHGVETGEISITSYTAVNPPVLAGTTFSDVHAASVTVTWDANNNPATAQYYLHASTSSIFNASGDLTFGWEANMVSTAATGLINNATYYFKIAARNSDQVETVYLNLGSTITDTSAPQNPGIDDVFTSSITASWSILSAPDKFILEASSTDFNGTGTIHSSSTLNTDVTALTVFEPALTPNTTYYLRAGFLWGDTTDYADTLSTYTHIETPVSIYIDELSTTSLTVSAYAPAFTNLHLSSSSINIAKDSAYTGWKVIADSWTAKASMLTARDKLTSAAVGGKIYVFGGDNSTALNTNEEYDPVADVWTTRAPMPTARYYAASAVVGDKIYVIAGHLGSNNAKNEEYDPVANQWTTRADMLTARSYLTACAAGGKVYAIGGHNGATAIKNEEYDPVTNQWTTRANMLTPRSYLTASAARGKVYAIGGTSSPSWQNEEYDPATNQWTSKANMPTGRGYLASTAAGGKIYVIGGWGGNYLGQNEVYDPAADTWTTQAFMPTGRDKLTGAAVGGKIYMIGGGNGTYMETIEEYNPGLSIGFTGLSPNTQYDFSVKARNQHGVETEEISISSYTAVNPPILAGTTFSDIYAASMTVTWDANNNPATAEYYLHASTSSIFNGANDLTFGWEANMVSTAATGLSSDTTYYFKVAARNSDSVETGYLNLGSTITGTFVPQNANITD